jgi:hypothetical protein
MISFSSTTKNIELFAKLCLILSKFFSIICIAFGFFERLYQSILSGLASRR